MLSFSNANVIMIANKTNRVKNVNCKFAIKGNKHVIHLKKPFAVIVHLKCISADEALD